MHRAAPRLLATVLVLGGALAACRGTARPAGPATPPPASAAPTPTAVYLLEGRGRAPVRVRLEVAATEAQRERGLAGRRSVPAGTGMVFLYPRDAQAEYWMKDTLVPLSIAFLAADGRVVSIAEMVPCHSDPCPLYAASGPYRYAVELAAGAFAAAGVSSGDRVVPEDPRSLPAAS